MQKNMNVTVCKKTMFDREGIAILDYAGGLDKFYPIEKRLYMTDTTYEVGSEFFRYIGILQDLGYKVNFKF